jgi:hypothetical protein
MNAREGPVLGSALRVSPTRSSDNASASIRRRRQIGTGSRPMIVTNPARIASRRVAIPQPAQRKRTMNRTTFFVTSGFAVLVSVAAIGIGAAVDTPRTLMSPVDYRVAKHAIEAESRLAIARCRAVEGSDKDICKAEARAAERVKKADLVARYHGTVVAAEEARLARVRASYDVEKARCGLRSGEQRSVCMRAAREGNGKALAVAKLAAI